MDGPISAADVPAYLVRRGLFADPGGLEVEVLAGGVSADVFAVRGEGKRVVLKRALERFRVADEWVVPRQRAAAEAAALRLMARLAPGSVPAVLDVDTEAFALVVEEAPPGWRPWKSQLLEGEAEARVAARLGELLGVLHREVDVQLGSRESFEAQRVDPYLRTVQRRRPGLAAEIERYVERLLAVERCLVHGDFSPKNVLVGDGGLWIVDWEVVHRGDPAFDLAFMLNHLLLKSIHRPASRGGYEPCAEAFLASYGPGVDDMPYVLGLVGCLMLARVDGKSPAEYLTDEGREHARAAGIEMLSDPPSSVADAWRAVAGYSSRSSRVSPKSTPSTHSPWRR